MRIKTISRQSVNHDTSKFILYTVIIVLAVFTALPLLYVIMTAVKPLNEIVKFPPQFIVRNPTWNNFADLGSALDSSTVPFVRSIFNSFFVSIVTVFFSVIVCSMGSYGMVKQKLPFSRALFLIIIAALMFSPQVTQISSYMVVNALGLVDTYWALILPKIAVAFYFFLIKQFVEQLPDPLIEAARIDGASEWKIFWTIAMPFLTPAWATLVVLSFVANWNDYFTPLIFITNQALKPLPLVLQTIGDNGNLARSGAMAAATFLTIIPPIALFMSMQKKVIETMTHSGIK
ncbi:MAG: carbohydrate ABC transporter permease [Saccharofermentanales bacterium]